MALMRTMGVDTGEGGAEQLHVTVSSGRRARGLQGEAEPPLVLSAERESISSACLAMQGLSDSYVFYGHVDQLLLGEELSRRGILETLQYFSQDQELGMGTQVWIVRGGTAAEASSAEQERGVESRLSTIQTDSEMGMAGTVSYTHLDVYKRQIVIGVCMVAFLYGVFVLFLHVPVPKGPLGF